VEAYHALLNGWKALPSNPPYIFPGDQGQKLNDGSVVFTSFESYVESEDFGSRSDKRLHLGLIPVPYVGSLERAHIFILMLNPGLRPSNYYFEYNDNVAEFRDLLFRNLYQETAYDSYPFFHLDPYCAGYPGSRYWLGKLGKLARELADTRQIRYQEALKILSQEIVTLQLIPYHSASFGAGALLNKLESTRLMKEYVHNVLVPQAERGEILLIIARRVKDWGLEKHESCIRYIGSKARGASLTPQSDGGKAIIQMMDKLLP
jgi:hypothetical protein